MCFGDLISQSTWLPMDNCGPFRNVSDLLSQLSKVNLSDENAVEVSEQVNVITSNTDDISSDDIASVASIVSDITDISQNDTRYNHEKVTESIVGIVSNIAEVDTETLESAEEKTGSVTDIIQTFEQQIKSIPVTSDTQLNFKQPKVTVKVQSVPTADIESGLVLSVAGDSLSDLTKSNSTIQTSGDENNNAEAAQPETIAVVNIPNDVTSAISSAAKGNTTVIFIRVIFTVFSSPALFISKSLQNRSSAGTNRSANTPVISLSIGDEKIENLSTPINFTFTPIESGHVNPSCTFWDEDYHGNLRGDWSQEGCYLLSAYGIRSSQYNKCDPPPPSSDEKIICGCDHLTNFAVLMDVYREDRPSDHAYKVLTYIGCGISILSLLVALVTYISNRVLREKQINQIFICLCLTLLSLYLSFIVMMSLDTARRQCKVKAGPCGLITALVHFFALSSISWMGVEGYNTYLIIVKIFDTYIPRFMLKAGAIAWGVPALIVIVTAVAARDNYAHEDICFLQIESQIGGFIIPMTIIIIFNVVVFGLVVRQLVKSSNVAGRVKREAKVERRENIERVQNAICILILLGLTWITGYFLMISPFSQVVEPIFIVLNSFQGLFIFLLYCVRKPVIRQQWGLTCLYGAKRQYTLSTRSTSTRSSKHLYMSVATTSSTTPHADDEKNVETTT